MPQTKKAIAFENLIDYVEGRLNAGERTALEQQLPTASPEIKDTLRWMQRFRAASERAAMPAPSDRVKQSLMAEFRARHDQMPSRASGILQSLATLLSFDSASAFATAGMRSAMTDPNRRMLVFQSNGVEVVLHATRSKPTAAFQVSGQVLVGSGSGGVNYVLQLVAKDTQAGITQTDGNGEFFLGNHPAGNYYLWASSDLQEIVTPTFTL